ncbi:hypothetical protein GCK72_003090 [Caenorhabditis remanei]|uniref:PAZ domain-containing protein n=1 Tax=Caenorhabditis remanei TaxID=31234 RepID=A0A6A5HWP8_CAERE|nr:hypothetical protein GCK72_003090 [Caenorhabditis remanei]KAF1771264.1 hypothetical protein GCK72_003090 [Caenorhabditis remanei]
MLFVRVFCATVVLGVVNASSVIPEWELAGQCGPCRYCLVLHGPSNCYFFNGKEWNTVFEYFYARYGMSLVDRNILVSFVGREEMGLFPIESLVVDIEED